MDFTWAILLLIVAIGAVVLNVLGVWKSKKMKKYVWIVAVIGAGLYFAPAYVTPLSFINNPVSFNQLAVANQPTNPVNPSGNLDVANCPSDGTTTYTVNAQDLLASTATNLNVDLYVFDGNKYVKSANTGSDGTVNIDLTCGKTYKAVALNTTTTSGVYAQKFDIPAYTSKDSKNLQMVQYGGAKILGIENPADPARLANISIGAGATKQFELKFVANTTQKGYNKPIIMCQVNITSISSVSIGSFSDGTPVLTVTALPKRITATSGYQYYAWQYGKMLDPSMGVIGASGSITAQSSSTPSTTDSMSCKLVDSATWTKSNFQSLSLENGFLEGAENADTLAEIGAPDSSAATLTYVNAGGY